MEMRTIMKLHFEELNKKVLELHDSQDEDNYREVQAIKNTAEKMSLAFKKALDDELVIGADCLYSNAREVLEYMENEEYEFKFNRVEKYGEKFKLTPYCPESVLDIDSLIWVFRLFNW